MANEPGSRDLSRARTWLGIAALALVGSALGALPHAWNWSRSGDPTYVADGDDLLYLAWSRGVVLGGDSGLSDAIHRSSGPMMHPWLLFVPAARVARELGLGMSGLGVIWRVWAGASIGLGLFWAIRPTTRRVGLAIGLAAFLLFDPGFLFGQPIRREIEIFSSLAAGGRSFLDGVPRIMPHLRVVTPALALPWLLIQFGAVYRARQGDGSGWRVLAVATTGVLFYTYFYHWTMVMLGLALAFACDPPGRRLYLLVMFGGLILGAPALYSSGEIKRTTPGDWLWRTGKFVPIGHFDEWLWPKGVILAWLATSPWIFRRRPLSIYPWCCTGAGLICLNHQLVTGLQIENEHWIGALGVPFGLLLVGLVVPRLERSLDASRAARWALGAIVAAQVAAGFGLRWVECSRSAETRTIHALYDRWRDDPAWRTLTEGEVVAGDPDALFVAAAFSRILPLSGRLVEFASRADDVELDERLILNLYLTGVDRSEALRRVELPAGSMSWEADATRSPAREKSQRRRRLALVEEVWTNPRRLLGLYEVARVVTALGTEGLHLQGFADRDVSSSTVQVWRIRGRPGLRR